MFNDKQFEEAFQLTKSKSERLTQVCCQHNPKTFCQGPDVPGKPGVRPEVEVLRVLKCVAFGCLMVLPSEIITKQQRVTDSQQIVGIVSEASAPEKNGKQFLFVGPHSASSWTSV